MKKHIICFGDSNTHGYCADPSDCADGGVRFNEDERWTCRLGKLLGEDYLVSEEGLSGRTTVFSDPIHEGLNGLSVIYPILKSHEFVDLLIIMLGTNDTKERFCANPYAIAKGLERLVTKARQTDCWGDHAPNVLIVAPPPLGEGFVDAIMGEGCREKSLALPALFEESARLTGCHFMDASDCEFNPVDHMHLSSKGHARLAEKLAEIIPTLV